MKHCKPTLDRRITLAMGRVFQPTVVLLGVAIFCVLLPVSAIANEKTIMGWLEPVIIDPLNFRVKAKLDTGAKTSSIHAIDIETFKRNGKTWVRFTFEAKDRKHGSNKDDETRRVTLERKRIRNVIIKRHNAKYQERPVVEMTLCINGNLHTEEFSLIDRSRFLYPILLGRHALKNMTLVDPGETFLTTTVNCNKKTTKPKD